MEVKTSDDSAEDGLLLSLHLSLDTEDADSILHTLGKLLLDHGDDSTEEDEWDWTGEEKPVTEPGKEPEDEPKPTIYEPKPEPTSPVEPEPKPEKPGPEETNEIPPANNATNPEKPGTEGQNNTEPFDYEANGYYYYYYDDYATNTTDTAEGTPGSFPFLFHLLLQPSLHLGCPRNP